MWRSSKHEDYKRNAPNLVFFHFSCPLNLVCVQIRRFKYTSLDGLGLVLLTYPLVIVFLVIVSFFFFSDFLSSQRPAPIFNRSFSARKSSSKLCGLFFFLSPVSISLSHSLFLYFDNDDAPARSITRRGWSWWLRNPWRRPAYQSTHK